MPLQVFTLAFVMLGIAALLQPRDFLRRLYPAVAFLLLAANLVLYGLYWPMFPAYLALAVCAVAVVLSRRKRRLLAWATLIPWLGSAALVYALPLFRLPAPTGPFAVGTRTEHFTDPATHRELVVQFWYPALSTGARARYMRLAETKPQFIYWHWVRTNAYQDAPLATNAQALPLLLFGHMWGGRRTQDTFLAEDLASHGYVVAALDHPGNSARIELASGAVLKSDRAKALSNVEATTAPAIRALWTRELDLWTGDNEDVLNRLLASPPTWLAGHIDPSRIGAFGHSFGGAATMNLLGRDPRVKAALNMDGWTFDALDHRATQPLLYLYAGVPPTTPTGTSVDDQLERQDLTAVKWSLARYGGCEAYIRNTEHADFTDETLLSPIQRLTYTGPLSPERVRLVVRSLVLAFFAQTLNHTGTLPAYPEVQTLCRP